jgi:5'-methylthioadenosine phosphorylase
MPPPPPPSSGPDPTPPPPLGIIGGSSFLEETAPGGMEARPRRVATPKGDVTLHEGDGFLFLRRHGEGIYRPPHRIPHHAHVLALQSLGVRQVVGLASGGSLDPGLPPGDVAVPDDYLSRHAPPTFAGDEYLHVVPELDEGLRRLLLEAARRAVGPGGARVHDGAVYAETRGPRFETRAEVRSLARDADLVGMTAASEATLCQERGLAYAVLCVVDNWAHGLGPEPLTTDAFRERQALNRALAGRILREVVGLGRAGADRTGGGRR